MGFPFTTRGSLRLTQLGARLVLPLSSGARNVVCNGASSPSFFVAAFARYTEHNTDDVGIHRQNRRTAYEIVTARASSRRFRQAAPVV